MVAKLFNLVRPDVAYLGQKDWQQALIIRRMARDLGFATHVEIVPTIREPDGLAISSRNAYLSPKQRQAAPRLYRALQAAGREARREGRTVESLRRTVEVALAGSPLRLQYVEVRDARTLSSPQRLDGEILVAAAAYLGSTRLIDNVVIEIPGEEQGS